jgi:hypothetical protein
MPPPDQTAIDQPPDAPKHQPLDPPEQSRGVGSFRSRDPNRPHPLGPPDDGDLLPALFTDNLLGSMMAALPSPERETIQQKTDRVTAAIIALRSFDAQEPIEAMLATHVVIAHHAALACYRLAAQDKQPPALTSRLLGNATNLSRTLTGVLRSLEQRQDRAMRLSDRDHS